MVLHPSLRSNAVARTKYCYFGKSIGSVGGADVALVCVGREECLPAYRVSAVSTPYQALEFISAGRGAVRTDDGQRELSPGTVFGYAHRSAPDMWTDVEHPMTKYFATFILESADGHPAPALLTPGEGLTLRHSPDLTTLQALFEAMIDEARRPTPISSEIAYRFLDLIVLKAEHANEQQDEQDSVAARSYEAACSCIEANFLELTGLSDLSERLALDSTYLCKLFRRFGAETPHQCIMRHKLNHAAELLLGGMLPVNRIASAVGFQDPFYFSRLFRKRFGMSPSQFRGDRRRTGVPKSPVDDA